MSHIISVQKFEIKKQVIRNVQYDLCVDNVATETELVANICQVSTSQQWIFDKTKS